MALFPIILLALVQGITEFLPISSSGHLVLIHGVVEDGKNFTDHQQKLLDISVHVGTLIAVMMYFYRDVLALLKGGIDVICLKPKTAQAQNSLKVICASLPVIVAGFVLFTVDMSIFDSLTIMAWMSVIFGVVLYIADRKPEAQTSVENFSFKQAILYGLAQCLALIPGVSRSGITMTAGRFMGHSRSEAARFSMWLGMVAIAGAGTLSGLSLIGDVMVSDDFLMILGIGAGVSALAAYGAIVLMMRWIRSASFTPFVIYRIGLGVILLALLYGGFVPQDINL